MWQAAQPGYNTVNFISHWCARQRRPAAAERSAHDDRRLNYNRFSVSTATSSVRTQWLRPSRGEVSGSSGGSGPSQSPTLARRAASAAPASLVVPASRPNRLKRRQLTHSHTATHATASVNLKQGFSKVSCGGRLSLGRRGLDLTVTDDESRQYKRLWVLTSLKALSLRHYYSISTPYYGHPLPNCCPLAGIAGSRLGAAVAVSGSIPAVSVAAAATESGSGDSVTHNRGGRCRTVKKNKNWGIFCM